MPIDSLLSWNRCSYVKDPQTGLRVARVNPRDQWEEVEVPGLRIVHPELWNAVKARQAAVQFEVSKDPSGQALNRAHRRNFLLSGLLKCGCCGGGYTIISPDRYGCAAHRSKNTCANSNTIKRQHLESRVLSGLKDSMLAPDLVADFIRAFAAESASIRAEAISSHSRLKSELADVKRRLEGVLQAVENGAWNNSLQTRLTELEVRQTTIEAKIAAGETEEVPIALHPNAAEIYKRKVTELEAALTDPDVCSEAGEALAALIDKIILTPAPEAPDRLQIDLHGELATILQAAGVGGVPNDTAPRGPVLGPRRAVVGGVLSVVAGACNHLYRTRITALAKR